MLHQVQKDTGIVPVNIQQYVKDMNDAYVIENPEAKGETSRYGDIPSEIAKRLAVQLDVDTWENMVIERSLKCEYLTYNDNVMEYGHAPIDFTGIPDLIARIDGQDVLIDWKTSPNKSTYGKEYHKFQLGMYVALAVKHDMISPDEWGVYHAKVIVVKNSLYERETTPFTGEIDFEFTEQALMNIENLVLDIISKILYADDRSKHMNWSTCNYCDFRQKCHAELLGERVDWRQTKNIRIDKNNLPDNLRIVE